MMFSVKEAYIVCVDLDPDVLWLDDTAECRAELHLCFDRRELVSGSLVYCEHKVFANLRACPIIHGRLVNNFFNLYD